MRNGRRKQFSENISNSELEEIMIGIFKYYNIPDFSWGDLMTEVYLKIPFLDNDFAEKKISNYRSYLLSTIKNIANGFHRKKKNNNVESYSFEKEGKSLGILDPHDSEEKPVAVMFDTAIKMVMQMNLNNAEEKLWWCLTRKYKTVRIQKIVGVQDPNIIYTRKTRLLKKIKKFAEGCDFQYL